jgi:hypothetical protein
VNDASRARSVSPGEWDRARRAYRALIGENDPAADVLGLTGAVDLRPGVRRPDSDDPIRRVVVLAGPGDLIELREIVEAATGVGTWPSGPSVAGEIRRGRLEITRPSSLLGLLVAMEGVIDDRSPWRTWRSAVDIVAARVREIGALSLEAVIVRPDG